MVKKNYTKIFIFSILASCIIHETHTIDLQFLKQTLRHYSYTLHHYSNKFFSIIKKHKVATAAITITGISLFFAYKPLLRFLFKKPINSTKDNTYPNEEIIKKIVPTIRAQPYYISLTTYVTELHLEKEWYEGHYDVDTIPFMALNIYDNQEFVEQRFITAKNVTILDHYRNLHQEFINRTNTTAG